MRAWRRAPRPWLVAALLAAGCTVGPVDLKGKACPCAPGWICDPSRNTCTLDETDRHFDRDIRDSLDGSMAPEPRNDGGHASTTDAGASKPEDAGTQASRDASNDAAAFDASSGMTSGDAGDDAGEPPDAGPDPACSSVSNTLASGQTLPAGSIRCSPDGRFVFGLNAQGVLELRKGPVVLWSAGSCCGRYVHMQKDGNLVVYDADVRPIFASNTATHPGAVLTVENDGRAVIWDGGAIWSTASP